MKPIVLATINSHIVTLKTTDDYGLEMSIAIMGLMVIKKNNTAAVLMTVKGRQLTLVKT